MKPWRVIVLDEAQLDLEAAAVWYEGQRTGLGFRFLEHLDRLFERLEEHPLQFPQIEPGVRRALLQRFPYGVYFTLEPNEEIVIFAILHLHRDPDTWKDRRPPEEAGSDA